MTRSYISSFVSDAAIACIKEATGASNSEIIRRAVIQLAERQKHKVPDEGLLARQRRRQQPKTRKPR